LVTHVPGEKILKDVLREELTSGDSATRRLLIDLQDIHSAFQWERFLEHGLDAHFIARIYELDGVERTARASDYWRQVNYISEFEGTLTLPRDKRGISIYSRRAFVYPQLSVRTMLPRLSLIGDEFGMRYYFGFENGGNIGNGIAAFYIYTTPITINELRVIIGTLPLPSCYLNIDVAKPSDFYYNYHLYRIVVSRNLVLFFIDSRLRAVAVQLLQGGYVKVKENVLPYSIALIPPLPSSLTTMIQLYAGDRTSVATSDTVAPLSPYWFRVSDGKEVVPLALPLYPDNTDSAMAGRSISSGNIASHPVPLFGYSRKTIRFMANQGGSLEIQVYTLSGNWRTYESVSISANTLLSYSIDDEVILARIVFTPSTYPATINEAEVSMS